MLMCVHVCDEDDDDAGPLPIQDTEHMGSCTCLFVCVCVCVWVTSGGILCSKRVKWAEDLSDVCVSDSSDSLCNAFNNNDDEDDGGDDGDEDESFYPTAVYFVIQLESLLRGSWCFYFPSFYPHFSSFL